MTHRHEETTTTETEETEVTPPEVVEDPTPDTDPGEDTAEMDATEGEADATEE